MGKFVKERRHFGNIVDPMATSKAHMIFFFFFEDLRSSHVYKRNSVSINSNSNCGNRRVVEQLGLRCELFFGRIWIWPIVVNTHDHDINCLSKLILTKTYRMHLQRFHASSPFP